MSRTAIQRGFLLSHAATPSRLIPSTSRAFTDNSSPFPSNKYIPAAPKVVQPSFWSALVPKFLRRSPDVTGPDGKKLPRQKKGWNPATYYIVMFLMIGSMSIQMISLKKDYATFTRRTDVRITLLRETVEKLQRGEKVDVERVLGTGDPEQEKQWEDVLKEIERDQVVKDYQKKQQELKAAEASPKPTTTTVTDEGFY
ncbi:hypothetical protein V8F33_006584 [Rhypophila sp. PSN 637]